MKIRSPKHYTNWQDTCKEIRKGIVTCFGLFSILLFFSCNSYTEGELIKENLPPKAALLIVDIQNDIMLPTGKLPVDSVQANRVIKVANEIIQSIDPNIIEVIYIANEFESSNWIRNLFTNFAVLKGTQGAELDSRLNRINQNFYTKSQRDAFSNLQLDQYLRQKNVNNLIIIGVYAEHCVLSTVRGALQRGYKVTIVSDAVASKNDKDLRKAFDTYNSIGVSLLSSKELNFDIYTKN